MESRILCPLAFLRKGDGQQGSSFNSTFADRGGDVLYHKPLLALIQGQSATVQFASCLEAAELIHQQSASCTLQKLVEKNK